VEVAGGPAGRLVTLATVTGTVPREMADGTVAGGVVATTVEGVGVVAGLIVVVARMATATVVTARKTGIGRV